MKWRKITINSIIQKIRFAFMISYIPCLLMVSVFIEDDASFVTIPYLFTFFTLFIYSFPLYMAFIQIDVVTDIIVANERMSIGEKTLSVFCIIFAVAIMILYFWIDIMLYVTVGLAILLIIIKKILSSIKREKRKTCYVKQRSTWIIAIVIFFLVSAIAIACIHF